MIAQVDRIVEVFDACDQLARTLPPMPEPGRSRVLAAVGRLEIGLRMADRRVNGTPQTGKPPARPQPKPTPKPATPPATDPPSNPPGGGR